MIFLFQLRQKAHKNEGGNFFLRRYSSPPAPLHFGEERAVLPIPAKIIRLLLPSPF
jgi:hypothetical protein